MGNYDLLAQWHLKVSINENKAKSLGGFTFSSFTFGSGRFSASNVVKISAEASAAGAAVSSGSLEGSVMSADFSSAESVLLCCSRSIVDDVVEGGDCNAGLKIAFFSYETLLFL